MPSHVYTCAPTLPSNSPMQVCMTNMFEITSEKKALKKAN